MAPTQKNPAMLNEFHAATFVKNLAIAEQATANH